MLRAKLVELDRAAAERREEFGVLHQRELVEARRASYAGLHQSLRTYHAELWRWCAARESAPAPPASLAEARRPTRDTYAETQLVASDAVLIREPRPVPRSTGRDRWCATRRCVRPYTPLCTIVRMVYLMLAGAVIMEVLGTTSMKYSDGFTRLWPTMGTAVAYVGAFALLAQTLKTLDVGVAYAIWAGAGTALIAAIGMVFLGEAVTAAKVFGVAMVIGGVALLNLSGGAH